MTLRQEVEQLIAEWQGLDAMDRSVKREQLVSDLIALMKKRARREHRPRSDRQPEPQAA